MTLTAPTMFIQWPVGVVILSPASPAEIAEALAKLETFLTSPPVSAAIQGDLFDDATNPPREG